jgi:hypothetical protein
MNFNTLVYDKIQGVLDKNNKVFYLFNIDTNYTPFKIHYQAVSEPNKPCHFDDLVYNEGEYGFYYKDEFYLLDDFRPF